ncbi:MAG: hypothetical protein AAF824_19795 [Bacteroidota bacterium]
MKHLAPSTHTIYYPDTLRELVAGIGSNELKRIKRKQTESNPLLEEIVNRLVERMKEFPDELLASNQVLDESGEYEAALMKIFSR